MKARPSVATSALVIGIAATVLIATFALIAAVSSSSPSRKSGGAAGDLLWSRPDFAALAPSGIALLPAASYDGSAERERVAGIAWAASFGRGGYRWVSASTSRSILSSDAAGDSLLRLARAGVLARARVDSLLAPLVCARLRVRALISLRLESWDVQAIEPDQSGKPWSRAYVRAALVDSLGRLLWSAAGGETVEGLEHEASSGATGMESTTPRSEFATGEGSPPAPLDVFSRLFTRWAAAFPARGTTP